jgi:SWI/SNF-related matrix-associated actin-dependent regulator of chromatin subfamily A-like protein 1
MTQIEKTATMAVNERGERVIKISFPYNLDTIDNIRSLPGRQWHKELKCWSAPIYLQSLEKLMTWGFILDDRLLLFIQGVKKRKDEIMSLDIPGLNGKLYPFQMEGVAITDHKEGKVLNADDMGLGKTIQTIAWLQLHPDLRPVIVIVPATLKINWEREIHKWMSNQCVTILEGTRPYTFSGDIIIINYDILFHWLGVLKLRDFKVMITDEAHYYKSNSAKRTKAIKMLAKGIPHVIALSGTPIESRPVEIYNALNLVNPNLFPKRWHFLNRYCKPTYNGYGWNYNGASNIAELHQILTTTCMIRRKKTQVLKDLPEKVRSYIPMELDNEEEYSKAEFDFIEWVKDTKGDDVARRVSQTEQISSIEALKQLAVKGKLKQAINWIEDFLQSDKKLVVFATHHFVIDALIAEFPDISVRVDGRVSQTERQSAVDRFQNDEKVKLFIGNIEAAGVGITLTAASDVVFLELPWTPAKLEQAIDRLHRIGQKFSVTVYFLLANHTIEEKIAHLLDIKRKIVDGILDGKESDEDSLFSELMKSYN